MKKLMLWIIVLAALSGAVLRAQDKAADIAGDWQGTLHVGNGLRIVLKISKLDSGEWTAMAYSIDQGPEGMAVPSITSQGSTLKFAITVVNGTYEGTLNPDRTMVSGTWTQNDTSHPLDLQRATKETKWPIDASPHTVQFITVDHDVKLEVLDWGGTGRPLVFLTGLGNNAHVFDKFAPKFTATNHVYGITRRGFGASSAPTPANGNYSADRLGDDVLAVLDALKLDHPVLAGHSIAGEELSSIGNRHPEKVAGLIYLDAAFAYAFYDSSRGDMQLDSIDMKKKLDQFLSGDVKDQKQFIQDLQVDISQLQKGLQEVQKQMAAMPAPPRTSPPPAIPIAILAGEQKYTEIHVPVLAICAVPHNLNQMFNSPALKNNPTAQAAITANDLARTSAQANAFEAGVPSAHVVRLPNADHYVFNSNEADVLREMNAFLANLPWRHIPQPNHGTRHKGEPSCRVFVFLGSHKGIPATRSIPSFCDTLLHIPGINLRGSYLTCLRTLTCLLPLALFASAQSPAPQVFGYRDFTQQAKWDTAFMAIPDPTLAGQHLKTLTSAPHWASSPEDHETALYVADKFKAAGLQTEIVPYKVLLNKPIKILIEAFDSAGNKLMSGPTPEHVDPNKYGGDLYQDDPRILPAFNGSSPSGDVTAGVVYANYGTIADFQKLVQLGISVKDKIVIVRYGENFRGIKAYIAQQYGAKGVLIYSDPADDGYFRGDVYPKGPWRPDTAVQRGSVQFLPIYPGDPTTPGIAATPDLSASKRIATDKLQANQPSIPVNPLSYKDAAPILKNLGGDESPRDWQGALPFTYHLGASAKNSPVSKVIVHMHLEQDIALRTIWDVIGTILGSNPTQKDNWVVAGNHRDAWVYGAVDPNSGTAAMLETVHGLGDLLKQGWKPARTIVICSWDAEEEGLMGSTEWAEQHERVLAHAVAYFNTDVAVSGPDFNASAVPSLKQFVRELTKEVPSPKGGTVYEQWKAEQTAIAANTNRRRPRPAVDADVRIGTLGSGSDYTPFIQHLGVPSTDIGSDGPYGVYHSTFDDYTWFTKFGDPTFAYEQQQARVFGLEVLHMADADVLPYDYQLYGTEVVSYLEAAQKRAADQKLTLDFTAAFAAAKRFAAAGAAIRATQAAPPADPTDLNRSLRAAEEALLNPEGLPKRAWYKHTIYAPGEFTGYAAVVIPGVNEAIEAANPALAQSQLVPLAEALNRSAAILEAAAK